MHQGNILIMVTKKDLHVEQKSGIKWMDKIVIWQFEKLTILTLTFHIIKNAHLKYSA